MSLTLSYNQAYSRLAITALQDWSRQLSAVAWGLTIPQFLQKKTPTSRSRSWQIPKFNGKFLVLPYRLQLWWNCHEYPITNLREVAHIQTDRQTDVGKNILRSGDGLTVVIFSDRAGAKKHTPHARKVSAELRISGSVRIYLRRSAAIFVSAAMNTYYFLRAIYKQLEKTTKRGSVTWLQLANGDPPRRSAPLRILSSPFFVT